MTKNTHDAMKKPIFALGCGGKHTIYSIVIKQCGRLNVNFDYHKQPT